MLIMKGEIYASNLVYWNELDSVDPKYVYAFLVCGSFIITFKFIKREFENSNTIDVEPVEGHVVCVGHAPEHLQSYLKLMEAELALAAKEGR